MKNPLMTAGLDRQMPHINFSTIKNIYCLGIGGSGVSGLAEMLLQKGFVVAGADVNVTATTQRLQAKGIQIYQGHHASQIKNADLVVYSSAVMSDNEEIKAAKQAGIPILSRGQVLAELMRSYSGIAVAGTHGKTTTTGFLSQTFMSAELDPSYVIGGCIQNQESSERLGNSRIFIAEADESDRSFLYMQPNSVVVTNIEPDHLENYHGEFDRLKKAFLLFINSISQDGMAVLGIDCPTIKSLLGSIEKPFKTFGFSKEADYRIEDCHLDGLKSWANVRRPDGSVLAIELSVPGRHNLLNALPSIVFSDVLQLPDDAILHGLKAFPGMNRRFQAHGEISVQGGKASLFEDYGHHPSAIQVTLAMAKQAWPKRRVVLVFQPHRYSRTRDLMKEFVGVLRQADELVLLDVYPASEPRDELGTSEKLCANLGNIGKQLHFITALEKAPKALEKILRAEDIVILQGAGNVGSLAASLKGIA